MWALPIALAITGAPALRGLARLERATAPAVLQAARPPASVLPLHLHGHGGHADWGSVLDTMTHENMKAFGHVYVLNLPQDTSRLLSMRRTLRDLSIPDFEVFNSSDGRDPKQVSKTQVNAMNRAGKGVTCGDTEVTDMSTSNANRGWVPGEKEATMGCYMSHLRILKDADAKGYASALIFEDDLDPVSDALSRLGAVNDLPQDWDMMYLGFHYHHHPGDYAGPLDASDCRPVSANLCKLQMPVLEQTHALAVHKRAYKPLIRMLSEAIATQKACPVDQMYRAFYASHPDLEVFATTSTLFEQLSSVGKVPSHIRAGPATAYDPHGSGIAAAAAAAHSDRNLAAAAALLRH